MKAINLVENRKANSDVYVKKDCSDIIKTAVKDFIDGVYLISGAKVRMVETDDLSSVEKGIIVARFDECGEFLNDYDQEYRLLEDSDGFTVKSKGEKVLVLATCDAGVFYGLHDLLEKNAEIIWCRGAEDYAVEVLPSDNITLKMIDYTEKPFFKVRVWNTCGEGSDGVDHGDAGTAKYMGRNKINGIFHHVLKEWYNYAIVGQSIASAEFRDIDDLMDEHPEYFMTLKDGTPRKTEELESYINYYNEEVPKVYARRMVDFLDRNNPQDILGWNMPDDPYFYMYHDGKVLNEQPFTCDDGTTVYPQQENYKSTVYFNFINRLIKEINEIRPNTIIHTQAYMYSLPAPAIKVDDRVVVKFAPLSANEKVFMNDPERNDNHNVRDMLLEWIKKSNRVCINAYWNSFQGHIYTRPILEVAKRSITWWREIGIYGFTPEGRTDCSKLKKYSDRQKIGRTFYDMNEFFSWALCKLMWNPDENIEELKERYCRIVYKECAEEIKEYFKAVEDGYNSQDAMVWYPTGPDIYIYRFIIKAGVKDRIIEALKKAIDKATTVNVKQKVQSIYNTLTPLIENYASFVKEDAEVGYCKGIDPLSDSEMDFINNPSSVWNTVKPQTVLRNYMDLKFIKPESKFSRRMLFDGENLYIGYSVYHPDMVSVKGNQEKTAIYDQKGREIFSRAETYIGGNSFNRNVYYGYASGFNSIRPEAFFEHDGRPVKIPVPNGVRDVKKVYLSENPEERRVFHVQVIPIEVLGVSEENFTPYGHFVYLSNKYGKTGWMGFGLWNKQNFSDFKLSKQHTQDDGRTN